MSDIPARRALTRQLNIDYAGIHGTYWMYYGFCSSFSSVFLLGKGYTNSQIGMLLAAGNILAIIVQPFLADIADRSKRISSFTMMQGMTIVLAGFTGLLLLPKEAGVALTFLYLMCFAWMMLLQPFCNAANGKLEECGVHINFGICRAVGSFAYAVLVAVLGRLVQAKGIGILPVTGLLTLALFFLVITRAGGQYRRNVPAAPGSAMVKAASGDPAAKTAGKADAAAGADCLPDGQAAGAAEEEIDLRRFIKRHKLFLLLSLGVMGVFFCNAVLNTYMAQIAFNVGGNSSDTGMIFSLLAFFEVPTLVFFDRINRRFSCAKLLKVASVAFVIWIGLCAAARSVLMLEIAQVMQLFGFALFLPAMVRFITENMEKGEAVKGQTLYVMVTTAAAIFASLLGGRILDIAGARALTLIGTCVAAAGAAIVILTVDRAARESAALQKGASYGAE